MRIYGILIIVTLMCGSAIAHHDDPPPKTPTSSWKPFLKGSAKETFTPTYRYHPSFAREKAGEPPRYFEAPETPFETNKQTRLAVSAKTKAFRSLGPLTHPDPSLKPQRSTPRFWNLEEKRVSSSPPQLKLERRYLS